MKNILCILLFFTYTSDLFAQNKILDSLWREYRRPGQPDTGRLKVLGSISHNYAFVNADSGRILASAMIKEAHGKKLVKLEAMGENSLGVNYMYMDSNEKALASFDRCYDLSEDIHDKAKMAAALMNMGMVYDLTSDHKKGLDLKLRSLKLREEVGDKKALGNSYANLGITYADLCDYPKAIEYYLKCQKVAEATGDKNLLANNFNNIGLVYLSMGEPNKALDYYLKSIELKEGLGNKRSLCNSLNNAATIYYRSGNYAKTWELYSRAYKIQQEIGNRRGIANSLSNFGVYYQDLPPEELKKTGLSTKQRYLKAISYHLQALKINEEINDLHSVSIDLNNLGLAYTEIGQLAEAEKILLRSVKMAHDIQEPDREETALGILASTYERMGNPAKAYDAYKRHIRLRDSIVNQEKNKDITRKQIQFEYDKRSTADSVKNAEAQKVKDAQITAQHAQLKQERTQRFALYGGLILLLVFGIFAYNRFRITQKQKLIIEEQKHIVEEKQREVLDSIHYARNIQRSLLPTEKYITRSLERLRHNQGKV